MIERKYLVEQKKTFLNTVKNFLVRLTGETNSDLMKIWLNIFYNYIYIYIYHWRQQHNIKRHEFHSTIFRHDEYFIPEIAFAHSSHSHRLNEGNHFSAISAISPLNLILLLFFFEQAFFRIHTPLLIKFLIKFTANHFFEN